LVGIPLLVFTSGPKDNSGSYLVFKSKAAHDEYSKAERHMKFIEENKDNWKNVRVFDSYLEP